MVTRETKPDKVKDAAILNDLAFYVGTSVFKRFKFLPNKGEIYNYQEKGSIGNVVMSKKVLNISFEDRECFCYKYAKKVSLIITDRRSSVRTGLKSSFIGK